MFEVNSVSEALPYIATAVGAGVGVALEAHAQHVIKGNQESLVAAWGDVIEQQEGPGRLRRVARYVGAPLVAACALAGFANGAVWESQPSAREVPPALEIVVDHSGATALGDAPAAGEITHIVNQFRDNEQIDARALIASSGEVLKTKVENVEKNAPFGDAPMEQATQSAIDDARLGSGRIKSANERSSAVLVITNGNAIGSPEDVATQANEGNVPVFVVNVEAGESDQQTTADLQAVAKETQATYWDANKKNVKQVSEDIQKVLVPQDVHDKPSDSPWPKRVFAAALSVLTVGTVYKKRRGMTLGNNVR